VEDDYAASLSILAWNFNSAPVQTHPYLSKWFTMTQRRGVRFQQKRGTGELSSKSILVIKVATNYHFPSHDSKDLYQEAGHKLDAIRELSVKIHKKFGFRIL
jgi:hypothetical protein